MHRRRPSATMRPKPLPWRGQTASRRRRQTAARRQTASRRLKIKTEWTTFPKRLKTARCHRANEATFPRRPTPRQKINAMRQPTRPRRSKRPPKRPPTSIRHGPTRRPRTSRSKRRRLLAPSRRSTCPLTRRWTRTRSSNPSFTTRGSSFSTCAKVRWIRWGVFGPRSAFLAHGGRRSCALDLARCDCPRVGPRCRRHGCWGDRL
mmetsp:Transcript_32201/g.113369  ORF Transcript_32201/g.113369 Transcript_32201/m.113369 type:complete len:205 (+) Transcript_32201:2075-2689(+)